MNSTFEKSTIEVCMIVRRIVPKDLVTHLYGVCQDVNLIPSTIALVNKYNTPDLLDRIIAGTVEEYLPKEYYESSIPVPLEQMARYTIFRYLTVSTQDFRDFLSRYNINITHAVLNIRPFSNATNYVHMYVDLMVDGASFDSNNIGDFSRAIKDVREMRSSNPPTTTLYVLDTKMIYTYLTIDDATRIRVSYTPKDHFSFYQYYLLSF